MPASRQPCGSVAALYRTGSGCVLHTFLSICVLSLQLHDLIQAALTFGHSKLEEKLQARGA